MHSKHFVQGKVVSKELPLPTASPPSSSSQSAVQVRQYTCRPFSKERSVSDIRREYVHLNVRNDHNFSVFPRQEPHVARVSLLDVVRKVGRSERLKGKEIKETTVKDLHDNREKVMTSSCHSRQNSEYKNPSFPTRSNDRRYGDLKIDKVSSSENARYAQTQLKEKGKVGKGECKTHGHSIRDVTVSSSDVINPSKDVNKPIARKRQVRVGQSLMSKAGASECMGNIYNQTYISFSFLLVIVINVVKRMLTLNSSKHSRITGRPSARQRECMGSNSHAAYLFQPRLLRAMKTIITGWWIKSSSCIPKGISGRQKQQVARDRAVFQNTLLSSGTILTPVAPPPCCCVSRLGNVLKETFLAGKYLNPFIFLFVALYVSYPTYFITYTINLVSDISFTAFWVLKYVYINVFYRSWPSYKWSTPLPAILYTLVNFASSPLHSVGKSHYKFPSIIINRVALWKKANVVIQYFLGHFRSCWREWRPLVTPWAWSIREGTELWRIQKWLPSSHAQVSLLPLSLLSFCPIFALIIVVIIIIALNMYWLRVCSKVPPFTNSLSLSLSLTLSLFLSSLSLPLSLSLSSLSLPRSLSLSLSLPLSLYGNGHCICSRLSNIYNETSKDCSVIRVHGYLTLITLTDLLTTLTHSPLSLSLYGNGHCICSRLSNIYNETSKDCCVIRVHGYLTLITITDLLTTLTHSPLSLSLYGHGHCICSRLSNIYNETSKDCCVIRVHGYLTLITLTNLLTTLTHSPLSLSLYGNGHCICSRLSNIYNETSKDCCVIRVHGYLTLITLTDLLTTLTHSPLSLSLYGNGHCICSRLSNIYNETSKDCCVIRVHGYLTPVTLTDLLTTLTHLSLSFSLLCLGPGRHIPVWRCNDWRVTKVGIHTQPCSLYIFIALGITIYSALGTMTCLAIGLWVWKQDSNCWTFLLSPTAPPPRTKVIGEPVARFARPFESRPADPVRREVFRQLASHPAAASASGWAPPKALLSSTPLPLQKGTEECSSKPVCPKAKGARRKLAF